MKLPADVFIHWLDINFPNWSAFLSGCFLGIFGTVALSFILIVLAPDRLLLSMPFIILFCAINTGYKVNQKRQTEMGLSLWLLIVVSGMITAVSGCIIQEYVDINIFQAQTPALLLGIYLACGIAGSYLGAVLRVKYEKSI